jgi:hypothetical protein
MKDWFKGLIRGIHKQLLRSGADDLVDSFSRLYADFTGKSGEDEGGSNWIQRFYLIGLVVMFVQGWVNPVTAVPLIIGAYLNFKFISRPINSIGTRIISKVANMDELRSQAVDVPLSELLQPQAVAVREDLFAAFDRVVLPQIIAGVQITATWILSRRLRR